MSEPAAARLSCRAGIARAGISRAGAFVTQLDALPRQRENSAQDANRWTYESVSAGASWTTTTEPPV